MTRRLTPATGSRVDENRLTKPGFVTDALVRRHHRAVPAMEDHGRQGNDGRGDDHR